MDTLTHKAILWLRIGMGSRMDVGTDLLGLQLAQRLAVWVLLQVQPIQP
ncbi:hypothetical protein Hdeb2414_s0014g00434081 [Helianthus debilis subsp. tardiflorus]